MVFSHPIRKIRIFLMKSLKPLCLCRSWVFWLKRSQGRYFGRSGKKNSKISNRVVEEFFLGYGTGAKPHQSGPQPPRKTARNPRAKPRAEASSL